MRSDPRHGHRWICGANPSAWTVTIVGPEVQFSRVNSPRSFVVPVGGSGPKVSWPMMALAPFTGRPAASTTRPVTVSPFVRTIALSRLADTRRTFFRYPRMLDVHPDVDTGSAAQRRGAIGPGRPS